MRVLVCGGRDFEDRDMVIRELQQRLCPEPDPDDMTTWLPPPDLVIAFPGGKGTADMVRKARAAGVEVIEV